MRRLGQNIINRLTRMLSIRLRRRDSPRYGMYVFMDLTGIPSQKTTPLLFCYT